MANPYALGRSSGSLGNAGVAPDDPTYAEMQSESYGVPEDATEGVENGYLDNPASAGAPNSQSGHAGVYWLPVTGPNYSIHQSDGAGARADFQDESSPVSGWKDSSARMQQAPGPLHDRRPDGAPGSYWGGDGIEGVPSKVRSQMGGEQLSATDIELTNRGVSPGDMRWTDNPRRNVPAEPSRLTANDSPSEFKFFRPFDQMNRPTEDAVFGSARHLNGQHVSMADHKRNYEILGMAPARTRRNTYRLEPSPWDEHIVDHPQAVRHTSATVEVIDIPTEAGSRRSYRLE